MEEGGFVAVMPHSSWAAVYDKVYQSSYGDQYELWNQRMLGYISQHVISHSRIVDFGAGTGRLSVPLAEQGHVVTAVDSSQPMLDQLVAKVGGSRLKLHLTPSTIELSKPMSEFDMAICVFSVLSYITVADELNRSLKVMAGCLSPGGHLLIEIPGRQQFTHSHIVNDLIDRRTAISSVGDEEYEYSENTTIKLDGGVTTYHDRFRLRCWGKERVLHSLKHLGLILVEQPQALAVGRYNDYFLFQKPLELGLSISGV